MLSCFSCIITFVPIGDSHVFCSQTGCSTVFWLKGLNFLLISTVYSGRLLFVISVGPKYEMKNPVLSPQFYQEGNFSQMDFWWCFVDVYEVVLVFSQC